MEEGELLVDFEGREVAYGFGEQDELVLAYATTVHKSQGSEYPAVAVPLTTQHFPMLQRNLVYTGVTRGKRLERSEEHTSELQSRQYVVCRLVVEKNKTPSR